LLVVEVRAKMKGVPLSRYQFVRVPILVYIALQFVLGFAIMVLLLLFPHWMSR